LRRFPNKKNTYGFKEIDDALKQEKLERHHDNVLRLNLLKIILSFIFPNKGRNVWVKYIDLVDDLQQFNKFPWGFLSFYLRNHIKAPAMGVVPAIEPPAVGAHVVGAPTIGSSSSATEIGAVVVRVCSQLEENGKMLLKLDDHGKMLHNHENLLRQVIPGEGLEVVKDLMVDDDVEVGREVNFKVISSDYVEEGNEKDDDDKKDVEEKVKSEEEQPQVAEEEDSEPLTVVTMVVAEVQAMRVAEVTKTDIVFFNQDEVVGEVYQFIYLQASADQTTVVCIKEKTIEVEKIEDEASQVTYLFFADQTTIVSVEEQTIEVAQTEVVISNQEEDLDEASQSKEEVEQNKEEVVEGKDDDDGNSQNKPDPKQLVLMESEVDVILKKRHALTEDEINERAFKMACRMNQLHAHLDEPLPRVLLESFIQRPISQDEKK
ncbi:hypothetical protein GIB67_000170, partial [Kingdonia uniflora]